MRRKYLIMNKKQDMIKDRIIDCIKIFGENAYYSIGFGSYWQDYERFNLNSDIDFFVLLHQEPSVHELFCFYEGIKNLSFQFQHHFSSQLFVGEKKQIFIGSDNIFRLLTVLGRKDKIVEIVNNIDFDIYNEFNNIIKRVNIVELIQHEIFKTTRFYNRDFYKFIDKIDLYRCKELINIYNGIKLYDDICNNNTIKFYLTSINKCYNQFLRNKDSFHLNKIINIINKNLYYFENRPKIISLMGIDGSGKTTQIDKIYEYLKKNKCKILKIKLGMIKDKYSEEEYKYYCDLIGINSYKSKQYLKVCLIAKEKIIQIFSDFLDYDYILFDRYLESLQGQSLECLDGARIFNIIFENIVLPDQNFFLEISPSLALKRLKVRDETLDVSMEQLKYRNEFYKNKFNFYKKNVVDASNDENEVFNEILKIIMEGINE